MKVTTIAADNAGFFEDLAPEGALTDENLFCMGAIANDGAACAVLVAGIHDEAACLEWIYTDPAYRRMRAARSLFDMLRTLLRRIGVTTILADYSDDCENMEEFLTETGFFVDSDRENYAIPVVDLLCSPLMDKLLETHQPDGRVFTLAEMNDRSGFYGYLEANGITLPEDEEAVWGNTLIRMDRKKKIDGCMLIRKHPEGDIVVPYLISNGLRGNARDIFRAFYDLVEKNGWWNETINFTDHAGKMIELAEKVLAEDRDSYIISGQKQGVCLL